MSVDDPWPIEGTITPHENGHTASLDGSVMNLTEGETNHLQAAVDRAARQYGEDVEVEVIFRGKLFEGCSSYELLGPVEEDD